MFDTLQYDTCTARLDAAKLHPFKCQSASKHEIDPWDAEVACTLYRTFRAFRIEVIMRGGAGFTFINI
jgi:hypothetical protein